MSLDLELFKEPEFTTTELDILGDVFTNPTVQKYLKHQVNLAVSAIATEGPGENEPAEFYLRRLAGVQASIACFKALLSIQRPSKNPSPESN